MNCYPRDLVDKHIKRFISSKFIKNNSNVEDKEIKYVTLPFLGYFSYQLRNTLSNLLRIHFPNINYRFIFVNRNTIGSLFRVKDPVLIAYFVFEYCLLFQMF